MDNNREDAWTPAPDVTGRDVPNGMILVSLRTGQCWHINATAAEFWHCLIESRSFESAIEEVARRYGAIHDQVAADLRQFAAQLSSEGALVPSSATGGSRR